MACMDETPEFRGRVLNLPARRTLAAFRCLAEGADLGAARRRGAAAPRTPGAAPGREPQREGRPGRMGPAIRPGPDPRTGGTRTTTLLHCTTRNSPMPAT